MVLLIPSFAYKCLLVLTLFFFNFAACGEIGLSHDIVNTETTLAIIKPDGLYGNHTDAVKKVILDSGFHILRELETQLDEETVKRFYAEHSSKSFFSSLIQYMTSGPVLIMVLEKENAVADWRKLIGPTDAKKAKLTHPHSIRAMCGVDAEKNCVPILEQKRKMIGGRDVAMWLGFEMQLMPYIFVFLLFLVIIR